MNKLQNWIITIAIFIFAVVVLLNALGKITLDWNMITAVGTVVTAIVAIVAVILEWARSRIALNVEIALDLDRRFNSPEIREDRRKTAEAIQHGRVQDPGQVLEFFGTIGILLRKEVLDKEVLWRMFFYWLHGYHFLLKKYIEEEKKQDRTSFESLEILYKELLAFENEKNNGMMVKTFKKDKFLTEEVALL